jgi:hypothetical protein
MTCVATITINILFILTEVIKLIIDILLWVFDLSPLYMSTSLSNLLITIFRSFGRIEIPYQNNQSEDFSSLVL